MISAVKTQNATNQKIIVYKPLPKSKRIKVFIPYQMKAEREAFKQLNTSFYHPTQFAAANGAW